MDSIVYQENVFCISKYFPLTEIEQERKMQLFSNKAGFIPFSNVLSAVPFSHLDYTFSLDSMIQLLKSMKYVSQTRLLKEGN
jgi:hypothetical protein